MSFLLLGASSQRQVDVFQLQRAENVTSRCVAVLRSEELDDQLFVAVERNGSFCILLLNDHDHHHIRPIRRVFLNQPDEDVFNLSLTLP